MVVVRFTDEQLIRVHLTWLGLVLADADSRLPCADLSTYSPVSQSNVPPFWARMHDQRRVASFTPHELNSTQLELLV